MPANTPTHAFAGSLVLALLAVVFWISGWVRRRNFVSSFRLDIPRLGGVALAERRAGVSGRHRSVLLLRVLIPSLKQLWSVPPKPKPDVPPPGVLPPPTVVAALLAILLTLAGAMNVRSAGSQASNPQPPLPQTVTQQIRVEDKFALATAKIHWQAEKGQTLPLLFEPAVLTHVNYPKSLDLEASPAGSRSAQQLVAQTAGEFDIEVQYQLPVTKRDTDSGFTLPVPSGLDQPRHGHARESGRGRVFAAGRFGAAQLDPSNTVAPRSCSLPAARGLAGSRAAAMCGTRNRFSTRNCRNFTFRPRASSRASIGFPSLRRRANSANCFQRAGGRDHHGGV